MIESSSPGGSTLYLRPGLAAFFLVVAVSPVFAACDMFLVGSPHPTLGTPGSLRVTDVDVDGRSDILYVTSGDGTSGPGVVICRGLGGGEYTAPALLSAGPGPAAIAILDYDKDGLPDFVVADTSDAYVRLFRNRGGGGFDAPRIVYANSVQSDIVSGDFDGDGFADIATASEPASSMAIMYGRGSEGIGDGSFSGPYVFRLGSNARPRFLLTDDVNGDGRGDIIAAPATGGVIEVFNYDLLNRRVIHEGEFPSGVEDPHGFARFTEPSPALPRFAIAGSHLAVVGGPQGPLSTWMAATQRCVAVGDLDRDGFDDMLVGGAWGLVHLHARAASGAAYGTFERADSLATPPVDELLLIDLDRDIHPEGVALSREARSWFVVSTECVPDPPTPIVPVSGPWPSGGLRAGASAIDPRSPTLVPDGSGGAFLAWEDTRGADRDVYVTHVLGDATPSPGWPLDGILALGGVGDDFEPRLVPDESGGAYVFARRPYGSASEARWQHVRADASPDPALPPGGASLLPGTAMTAFAAVADGDGGFDYVFQDTTAGGASTLRANRWSRPGAATTWPPEGLLLASGNSAFRLKALADGGGGMMVAWTKQYTFCTNTMCFPYDESELVGIADGNVYRKHEELAYIFTLDPDPIGGIVGTSAGDHGYQGFRDDPARPAWTTSLSTGAEASCGDGLGGAWFAIPQASGIEFVHAGIGGTVLRRIGSSIPSGSIAGMEGDGLGGFHAAAFDSGGVLVVHHINDAGFFENPRATSDAVRNAGFDLVPDGTGGVLLAWIDDRGGAPALYLSRAGFDPTRFRVTANPPTYADGTVRLSWQINSGLSFDYALERTDLADQAHRFVAALRSGGGTLVLPDAAVIPGHTYAYVLTARRPGDGALVYVGEPIQVIVPPLTVSALVPDYVDGAMRFRWRIEGGAMLDYALLRTDPGSVVTATVAFARHGDGNLELADPDVLPGRSYSYVLEGHLSTTGELAYRGPETLVTVPEEPAPSFALALDVRTPARRGDAILFSLPQMGPATLVLHDVRGKRVASMDAGESGAGWHPFDPGDLKAGVYWLTLVQGGKRIIRKMVWLD